MRAYSCALFLNLEGISIFDESRGYIHLAFVWFRLHHVMHPAMQKGPRPPRTRWGYQARPCAFSLPRSPQLGLSPRGS